MARSVLEGVDSLVGCIEGLWVELVEKPNHLGGDVLVSPHEDVHRRFSDTTQLVGAW